jgi:aminobenzoyl-glutamate utilization protein B
VAQGKSSIAHKSLIYAGQVLAATGIDLLENPEFVEKAKEELKSRLGDGSYQCPIPKDINPRSLQIKRGVE